jgi:hypothetical protein
VHVQKFLERRAARIIDKVGLVLGDSLGRSKEPQVNSDHEDDPGDA